MSAAGNAVRIARSRLANAVKSGDQERQDNARQLLALAKAQQHLYDYNALVASTDFSDLALTASAHHLDQANLYLAAANGNTEEEQARLQLRQEFRSALATDYWSGNEVAEAAQREALQAEFRQHIT